MDINQVADVLKGRGWEVEIKKADEVEDLVSVDEKGLFKCVDGRMSNKADAMRGPKTLGGVYAVVASRGKRDLESLKAAVKEVAEKGYVPSVHGDDHSDPAPMGCGFFKLWVTGQLEDLDKPEYTAEEGKEVALEAGAVYEELVGGHEEEVVVINFVEGKTLEPDNTRFIVDAWVADEFDLDQGEYLTRAAETVEKLNGPKKAVLIEAR